MPFCLVILPDFFSINFVLINCKTRPFYNLNVPPRCLTVSLQSRCKRDNRNVVYGLLRYPVCMCCLHVTNRSCKTMTLSHVHKVSQYAMAVPISLLDTCLSVRQDRSCTLSQRPTCTCATSAAAAPGSAAPPLGWLNPWEVAAAFCAASRARVVRQAACSKGESDKCRH